MYHVTNNFFLFIFIFIVTLKWKKNIISTFHFYISKYKNWNYQIDRKNKNALNQHKFSKTILQ